MMSATKHFRIHDYTKVDKITKALSEEDLIKEIKDVHILWDPLEDPDHPEHP